MSIRIFHEMLYVHLTYPVIALLYLLVERFEC
jgi:hypothetical protein